MAAYDDLDVKRIFAVGIGSVVVTAVTALAVQTLYGWMVQKQQIETAAKSEYRRQNKILDDQAQAIAKFGVDPVTANYVIPIDEAIKLVATPDSDAHSHDDHDSHDAADHQHDHDSDDSHQHDHEKHET